jgi:hypothetical protein
LDNSNPSFFVPDALRAIDKRGSLPSGCSTSSKNEGVIIEITRDTGKLKGAFDHAERGIAITIRDSVAERAVIRADPHRDAALFA